MKHRQFEDDFQMVGSGNSAKLNPMKAYNNFDDDEDEWDDSADPIPRMLAVKLEVLNRDLIAQIVLQGLDALTAKDTRELIIGESVKQLREMLVGDSMKHLGWKMSTDPMMPCVSISNQNEEFAVLGDIF